MMKVPWAKPLEDFLKPFEWVVNIGLVIIILVTTWILIKGNATAKTAWFVYMFTP